MNVVPSDTLSTDGRIMIPRDDVQLKGSVVPAELLKFRVVLEVLVE